MLLAMGARSGRSVRNLLAWLIVTAAAGAIAFLWAPRDVAAQEADTIGDVDLGGQLYAQACAQCHASDGGGAEVPGTNRQAPALAGRPNVTAAYVDLVMRTGRMPPAANPFDNQPRAIAFDDEERLAIVAFTVQEFDLVNDLDEIIGGLPEGDAGRGQAVYAENCAACHGNTGAGGVAGGGAWTPTVSTYDTATIAEATRIGPFQMPAFGDDIVSDQEIGDIGAFLEEVRAEPGTPLGLVELNPVFASGFVALLAVVMIVSLFWISSRPTWFPDPEAERDDEQAGGTTPTAVRSADTTEQP